MEEGSWRWRAEAGPDNPSPWSPLMGELGEGRSPSRAARATGAEVRDATGLQEAGPALLTCTAWGLGWVSTSPTSGSHPPEEGPAQEDQVLLPPEP